MGEERVVDFPYAIETIGDAARTVFERAEWGIKKADRAAGRYQAIVKLRQGLLIYPIHETLYVDLTRLGENLTRVSTRIRTHLLHWGTTRQHIDSFLIELKKILEGGQ